jgi:hypothetical protein
MTEASISKVSLENIEYNLGLVFGLGRGGVEKWFAPNKGFWWATRGGV